MTVLGSAFLTEAQRGTPGSVYVHKFDIVAIYKLLSRKQK